MVNNINFSLSFCLDLKKIKITYLHTHTLLAPAKNMYSNVIHYKTLLKIIFIIFKDLSPTSHRRINLMVVASSFVVLREPSTFKGGSLCTPVDTFSYVSFLDVHNIMVLSNFVLNVLNNVEFHWCLVLLSWTCLWPWSTWQCVFLRICHYIIWIYHNFVACWWAQFSVEDHDLDET